MRILTVFTFMTCSHLLNAFTISVPKDFLVVEYGRNVTMECTFPVGKQLNLTVLVVYWEKENKKIIQFVDGEEDMKVQHSSYSQRAHLLKDQLALGKAVLQITDVKLRDAGDYRCLISYGGADYKRITLKVNAPYRKINQRISVDPVTLEHELMCQAEGFPEAEVIWTNSDHQILRSHTNITKGQEELFNVTSTLRVNTTAKEVFRCAFRRIGHEENSTAELIIPELPDVSLPIKRTHLIIVAAVLLFLGVLLMVVCYLKRDGVSLSAVVTAGGRMMDLEKGGVRARHSKKQNDAKLEET